MSQFNDFQNYYKELYTKFSNKKLKKTEVNIVVNKIEEILDQLYITPDMGLIFHYKHDIISIGSTIRNAITNNKYKGSMFKKYNKLLDKFYFETAKH